MRPEISLVVIAMNEEAKIEACLRSAAPLVSEMLVVDSGSTDATVQIAERMGARVIHQDFLGHIEQKNFAMRSANNDWVLSLDADELLSEELISGMVELELSEHAFSAYEMNRRNQYCGKWIKHSDWYPDRKIRLWDRRKGRWGGVNPHDKVVVAGSASIGRLQGDILHYTMEQIADHWTQARKFGRIGAEHLRDRSHAYLFGKAALSPLVRFFKMFFLKLGFLDGWRGFMIAWITSHEVWWKYSGALRFKLKFDK